MVLLDPPLARKLLAASHQVDVRHERLLWIAENFELLHNSPISLGEDGTLNDGHHRCTVVVTTGRTLIVDFQTDPYTVEL